MARVQNDNAAPVIELRIIGTGRAFVQALARTIVRAELSAAGIVAKTELRPT